MIQFVAGKNPVMDIPIPSGQIQTYKTKWATLN